MNNDVHSTASILVVDDQVDIRTTLQYLLREKNYQVLNAESPSQALSIIESHPVDMVLTDMNFRKDTTSGKEGLAFVKSLNQLYPDITVLVMTAWSTVSLAVQAMQLGARDFIEKPWENKQLFDIISEQLRIPPQKKFENETLQFTSGIISESDAFNHVLQKIEKVSLSHANVLLTGENGTGKSLLAKHIHQCSQRNEHPFVSVNLGAVPEQLFESELFGHKRGAYTDAIEDRVGRFESAGKGTLFLDELATTCLSNQAKLLRVLESKEYERIGCSQTNHVECRVVSATNANLRHLIASKEFREDLYYRLNTVEINVPSLRERIEDILPIANYYLAKLGEEYKKPEMRLSKGCQDKLLAHTWPGNTRELKHIIERAVIFTDASTIGLDDLDFSSQPVTKTETQQIVPLAQIEEELIKKALEQANGNINVSAELLGISRSALYRRIEKHGVKHKKLF
ncbi:sigma-54-dependent transcriptional regulator [Thalassotalea fusca]